MTDFNKIKELALANGFKLKEQASGNMDLNAYVYDFANAIEQAAKAQAVPDQIKEHIDINYDEDREDDQHSYWSGYNQALREIKAMIEAQEPTND